MSKNIKQVYDASPITSNTSTDLMYFGQSPYGVTNDAAMLYSNFAAQFTTSATSATAGKILRSNGSAWVASTSTFADTYSSGTVLASQTANTITGLAYSSASGVSTLMARDANGNIQTNNFIYGYATTATAAATTTLTVSSAQLQYFTGSTTQTVLLPVTSTLVLGQSFRIVNNSSGVVTVQSSGANTIQAMAANTVMMVTCILTSGTSAASWSSSYTTGSLTLPLSIANGGTGVSSVTTTPTASSWAGWDANSNFSANNLINGYTTTATAAGTTTLTVSSTQQQYFTGSTTQTVLLPVASTLVLGQNFRIVNNSTGIVTVQSSGANTVQAMDAGTSLLVTCILTSGTTETSWSVSYPITNATTASAGKILRSNGSAWVASTSTFADTYTSGTVLAAQTTNTVTGLAYSSASGVSTLLARDASGNTQTNSFIYGYTTTATSAGTLTLTVSSAQQQYFTGSTTHTVVLPVTSTLVLGQSFRIINNSSGVVTVQSSGANTIQAMATGTSLLVTCILTSGTSAASWGASYSFMTGGVSSITGTANQVVASSSTGDVTLSLPQSIATSSSPTFASSTFTGAALTNKQFTANSSTAITIDPANGPYQTITLTGNALITLAAVPSATTEREFILELLQDGTGSRTVTWSNITFVSGGGVAPVIASAIGASTYIGISGTSSAWIGYPVNQGLGVTDASNAAVGYVGEVISSTIAIGSATSLTSTTAKTITSISLTPGDWHVYGNIGFIAASTTLITVITGSVSTTDNTQATSPNTGGFAQLSLPFTASTTQVLPIGGTRINISATATYYLVATATFSTSTCTGYGSIIARRMR